MPMSYRVAQDQFINKCEIYTTKSKNCNLIVDEYRDGKWRIYEYSNEYSSTSGGFLKRGKVIKRYDPDAGDQEGRIAQFKTNEDALNYCKNYLDPVSWRSK